MYPFDLITLISSGTTVESEAEGLKPGDYQCQIIYVTQYNLVRRAGRSVVDRYLGMVEAAGSIPARSIFYSFTQKDSIGSINPILNGSLFGP